MKKLSLKVVLPVVFVFSLFSCSPDPLDTVSADPKKADVSYAYSEDEIEVANLVNDYRESIGLNRLELVNYVSVKSEQHDYYMIQNKEVSHAGFKERADDIIRTTGASRVNENIAYNFNSGQGALNAWLSSTGHKANIEGNFTHFGISIRIDETTGKKYYTNIFIKK